MKEDDFRELTTKIHDLETHFNESMSRLEKNIQENINEIKISLNSYQCKEVEKHSEILLGTPESKGLPTRLALLEQTIKRWKWAINLLWGTMISLFIYLFKDIIGEVK